MFKKLSQKNFVIILIAVLIFSAGIVSVLSQINNQNQTNSQTSKSTSNSVSNLASSFPKNQISQNQTLEIQTNSISKNEKTRKISQQEFEKHFAKTDCWVSFEKKVYNVTTYLLIHPGGQSSLAKFCSREIDKSSSTHLGGPFGSIKIQDILAPFLVGELE